MTCAGVMKEKLSMVANVKKAPFLVVVFIFFMSTKVVEIMLFSSRLGVERHTSRGESVARQCHSL
jgi:hypothetical protein